MPLTLQQYLARATEKTAAELEEIFQELPEERRNWSPSERTRSAADQIAECALLNINTIRLITNPTQPPPFDSARYLEEKARLAQEGEALLTAFRESVAGVAAAIEAVSDEQLDLEIPLPWGTMTVLQLMGFPYWNQSYHEGQINYIHTLYGDDTAPVPF